MLSDNQFKSGVEYDGLKREHLVQGECHTSTGLILETDSMINGEVWGDKHDKQDKLNEQVDSDIRYCLFKQSYLNLCNLLHYTKL